ncbi:MAG TPA: hypothetical protein VGG64_02775 [Pirellulales bacterium]|jgi:hypothetical protein
MSGKSWKSSGTRILATKSAHGAWSNERRVKPRVDLAALVELERLLRARASPADSRSDSAIVREENHDASQIAGDDI